MKNKKSVILIVYGVIYVILFVIIFVLIMNIVNVKKYVKQITLGNKYYEELDYENAELCYLAAIEIDEKNAEAYIRLTEVYIDTSQYSDAANILDYAQAHVSEDDYARIEASRHKLEEKQSQLNHLSNGETEQTPTPIEEVSEHPELEAYRTFLSNDDWIDLYESDYYQKEMAVFDLNLDGVYEVALLYGGSSWQNYTTGLLSYSDGRILSDLSYSEGNMGSIIEGIDEQNGRYIFHPTRGKNTRCIMQFVMGEPDHELGRYFPFYFHRNGGHNDISVEQEYDQYVATMKSPNYVDITPENLNYYLSGDGIPTGFSAYDN